MTWQGTKITVSGFVDIFSGYGVSKPEKNAKLNIYECRVTLDGRSHLLQAQTLVELSRDVVGYLIRGGSHVS